MEIGAVHSAYSPLLSSNISRSPRSGRKDTPVEEIHGSPKRPEFMQRLVKLDLAARSAETSQSLSAQEPQRAKRPAVSEKPSPEFSSTSDFLALHAFADD